jgi:hypothetical protein
VRRGGRCAAGGAGLPGVLVAVLIFAAAPAAARAADGSSGPAPSPGSGSGSGAGAGPAPSPGSGSGAVTAPGGAAPADAPESLGARPGARIDLVFVIDSTGSMGGVLALAKAEMARILAELRATDPPPDLRLGIVTYRDKGDTYRVRYVELTRDLDAAYSYLLGIAPGGGADWPEDVNHALMVTVTRLNWDLDKNTARVVFLVGDAPPHMDYAGEPTYVDAARIARARGIVINTIATNADEKVELHWRAIAAATMGEFDRIDPSTGTPVVGKASGASGAAVGAGARSGLHEGLTREELGPEGASDGAGEAGKGAPARSKLGDLVIEGTKKAAAAKRGGAASGGTAPAPAPALGPGGPAPKPPRKK